MVLNCKNLSIPLVLTIHVLGVRKDTNSWCSNHNIVFEVQLIYEKFLSKLCKLVHLPILGRTGDEVIDELFQRNVGSVSIKSAEAEHDFIHAGSAVCNPVFQGGILFFGDVV